MGAGGGDVYVFGGVVGGPDDEADPPCDEEDLDGDDDEPRALTDEGFHGRGSEG
jgi:hypothetical protein